MSAEPNLHGVVPYPPPQEQECLHGLVMVHGQGWVAFFCRNSTIPKAVSKLGIVI